MGGIGGLILGGFAFAIPQILSETVLQPSGGQGFGTQEAGSCDDIFRRELILQPNANTGPRMNQVIRVIQQREEDCLTDNWDPEVGLQGHVDLATAATAWVSGDLRADCVASTELPASDTYTVDGLTVPARLLETEGGFTVPSKDSVRDVNDNILVYFSALPTDLSKCWMYLSRDQLWVAVQ